MDSQEADSSMTARDKESKWNHRRSLAWDSAFFTTPGVLDHEELFGSLKIGGNEIDVNHKDSIKILPCVSSRIAARPSFAWDNAFFTEPGVLDAEELSLVNNGFTSNTQPRNSADSLTTTTEGSRFSVSSIEFDLFHDLRASLSNTPNVKQTGALEMEHKLPDGKKRTKCYKLKGQTLSLIPRPKVCLSSSSSSSSSSSISKSLTPRQAKTEKKPVASGFGKNNKGQHNNNGFEEKSGSKSTIPSSYSGYTGKILTSSSSGLKLPLQKMDFFDSEKNGDKENEVPNVADRRRRQYKSKLETSSPPDNPTVLGQRRTRK